MTATDDIFEPAGLELPPFVMEPEPPPLLAAAPAWLPPLCDAYTEKEVYLWHKLTYDGRGDLDPQTCGEDSLGGRPEWFLQEDDTSLDTILSPEGTYANYGGHEFRDQWIRWALQEGLAPGQPFLVRIGQPHYSKDYYGECDVEWDVEVVRAMPRTPKQAVRAWDAILRSVRRYYDLFLKRRERLLLLQDTDTSVWSLVDEPYFARGTGHDDIDMPGGLRVFLCSKHSSMWGESKSAWPTRLISGDDDDGDFRKACRNLLRNIQKHRPRINLADVFPLLKGRAGITRWEHLVWDLDGVLGGS